MLQFIIFIFILIFHESISFCGIGSIEVSNSTCINISSAFPPNPSIPSPFCLPGWSYSAYFSKCYRIFQIKLDSYRLARNLCKTFNSSLVMITSEEDQSSFYEISTRGWFPEADPDSGDFAWMGVSIKDELNWILENGGPLDTSFMAKDADVHDDEAEVGKRHCGVFDPNAIANNGRQGGIRVITCEGTKHPVGNVLCQQQLSLSNSTLAIDCERGWYFYEKTTLCYKIMHGVLTKEERIEQCHKYKSELVNIGSTDEMDFVAHLILSGWRLPDRRKSRNLVWIGSVKNNLLLSNGTDENPSKSCFTLDPQVSSDFDGNKYKGEIHLEACDLNYTHFVCSREKYIQNKEIPAFSQKLKILMLTSIAIGFLLVIGIVFLFVLFKRRNGIRGPHLLTNIIPLKSLQPDSVEAYPLLEIEKSFKLEDINFVQTIGSGKFGCVFSAEIVLNEIPLKVAVKRCRICGYHEHLKILSSELATMTKLATHPNVVQLIGSVTTEIKKSGQLYIVTELCEFRSIHSFLSKFQMSNYIEVVDKNRKVDGGYYNNKKEEYGYMNSSEERKNFAVNELRTTDLLVFSVQIANGLSFLADNLCIHRDLAARNILLTSDFICKISDFGLARFVEPNYYNAQTTNSSEMGALPERWMAPESLENDIFSFATDVWSFGIVLFEMFSFGKQPYFKFTQDEVRNAVLSGEINEQPEYCESEIYDMMKRCWNREAVNRPTIQKCHECLKKHLKEYFPARSEHLDDAIHKETLRQEEIKNSFNPRNYYNT